MPLHDLLGLGVIKMHLPWSTQFDSMNLVKEFNSFFLDQLKSIDSLWYICINLPWSTHSFCTSFYQMILIHLPWSTQFDPMLYMKALNWFLKVVYMSWSSDTDVSEWFLFIWVDQIKKTWVLFIRFIGSNWVDQGKYISSKWFVQKMDRRL